LGSVPVTPLNIECRTTTANNVYAMTVIMRIKIKYVKNVILYARDVVQDINIVLNVIRDLYSRTINVTAPPHIKYLIFRVLFPHVSTMILLLDHKLNLRVLRNNLFCP